MAAATGGYHSTAVGENGALFVCGISEYAGEYGLETRLFIRGILFIFFSLSSAPPWPCRACILPSLRGQRRRRREHGEGWCGASWVGAALQGIAGRDGLVVSWTALMLT